MSDETKIEVPLSVQAIISLKWGLILSGVVFWYVLGAVTMGRQFGIPGLYPQAEATQESAEFSLESPPKRRH